MGLAKQTAYAVKFSAMTEGKGLAQRRGRRTTQKQRKQENPQNNTNKRNSGIQKSWQRRPPRQSCRKFLRRCIANTFFLPLWNNGRRGWHKIREEQVYTVYTNFLSTKPQDFRYTKQAKIMLKTEHPKPKDKNTTNIIIINKLILYTIVIKITNTH